MNQNMATSNSSNPSASDSLLFHELQQAELHVKSIHDVNEQESVEVGQLHGMHRILKNAERALATSRASLVARMIRHSPAPSGK